MCCRCMCLCSEYSTAAVGTVNVRTVKIIGDITVGVVLNVVAESIFSEGACAASTLLIKCHLLLLRVLML